MEGFKLFCNMWSSIKQSWRCLYAGKNVKKNNILQAAQVSLIFFSVQFFQMCNYFIISNHYLFIIYTLVMITCYRILISFSLIWNKRWDDMRVLMVTFHLVCNVPRHGHKPNSLLNNFNWYKDTDGEDKTMGRTKVLSNVM